MKIGILTFHYSRNYGAVLQAYGLKKVLGDMGYEVEVIDYRNSTIDYKKHPFNIKHFKAAPISYVLHFFSTYLNYRRKVRNFASFSYKNLNVTTTKYLPVDIKQSDYDTIIIGSDQVWNPLLTNGPDPVYWGIFKPQKARMITYGASSGAMSLFETEEFINVGNWLEKFDAISVREERLKVFVETHSRRKAAIVVDPTILAGRTVFESLTLPRIFKKPYILVYSVEGMGKVTAISKKVAEVYNAKIIRIGGFGLLSVFDDLKNGVTYKNASIEEMLSLIKFAECIVAMSFHGTVLSLLFEKDFYSVKGNNMARVESVLKKCNLMDRIADSPNKISLSHIDYSFARDVLTDLRIDSLNWLKMSLGCGDI